MQKSDLCAQGMRVILEGGISHPDKHEEMFQLGYISMTFVKALITATGRPENEILPFYQYLFQIRNIRNGFMVEKKIFYR